MSNLIQDLIDKDKMYMKVHTFLFVKIIIQDATSYKLYKALTFGLKSIALKPVFLITPPFTQLNTPYPATVYLKGFLNTKGIASYQMDLGIEVTLQLFSKNSLSHIFNVALALGRIQSENAHRIYALREKYVHTIESVLLFLQGKNASLARQVCSGNFLPTASRFELLDDMEWAFGNMGMQDKAKHLCTLYLEDVSDFIVECIDEHFGFSRYAEHLGRSANSFDDLYAHLQGAPSYIDEISFSILDKQLNEKQPELVCFSVPFPGNLLSAFRCAQFIKEHHPSIKVAMGGGFPNTELRSLTDKRVFDYFDFISLDDGELPIELLIDYVHEPRSKPFLKRTYHLENDTVVYNNYSIRSDYKQPALGTPDYSDLKLDNYISVIEIANPMHSLWSDGRWNKLTMAHGCYWGKCTFCDVSLDYIKSYEPLTATVLVDRMEELISKTGECGFHFVDEAAPPALMKAVAVEIIKRKLIVTWWTNIRFEKSFTKDVCKLLKASGCIAVSGGMEVASDRLLALIDKGVSVEQVARVTRNFTEAGMLVHAYLMYGYPTQTVQETVDSLEIVRQLFELGIVQSGFWHQFALTAHSPISLDPDSYGIHPIQKEISFGNNDVDFTDNTGINHNLFSYGLKKSLFNYMHRICFEYDLQQWFDFKIPKTRIAPNYIHDCLEIEKNMIEKPSQKFLWIGTTPTIGDLKKGKQTISLHTEDECVRVKLASKEAEWFMVFVRNLSHLQIITYQEIKEDFEKSFQDFELFWYSKAMEQIKDVGLLKV